MDADQAGHWVEPPLLPTAAAPPPNLIQVRGARLVRVYGPDGPAKRDGGRDAVILAWARTPDGGWAILLAWAGHYVFDAGPHQTEAARWAWCRYDEMQVKPRRPPQILYDGAEWNGWHRDSQINVAVREAAASLPEHLREAAVTPASPSRL